MQSWLEGYLDQKDSWLLAPLQIGLETPVHQVRASPRVRSRRVIVMIACKAPIPALYIKEYTEGPWRKLA